MSNEDGFELKGSLEGKSKKRISPQDDSRLRIIAKYGLDQKITPKELEIFVDRKEREETVLNCHNEDPDCPLDPSAGWAEINAYHKERARIAWALHNGLDPAKYSEDEVNTHVVEKGRLEEAKRAGLPPDTGWDAITLHFMRIEEERRKRGGNIGGEGPRK